MNPTEIIDKVWKALGCETYEDAQGKTIWELVSDWRLRAMEAERRNSVAVCMYCGSESTRSIEAMSAHAATCSRRPDHEKWKDLLASLELKESDPKGADSVPDASKTSTASSNP